MEKFALTTIGPGSSTPEPNERGDKSGYGSHNQIQSMNQESMSPVSDFERGNAHFRNGDYDKSVSLYQQALQSNKGFSHYYRNLAKALHHLGKHAEANAAEREARILDLEAAHLQPRPEEKKIITTIKTIKTKLFSLGFSDHPLEELKEITEKSCSSFARSKAARELMLWHMHQRETSSHETALEWLSIARRDAPTIDFRSKLATLELICRYHLGDREGGLATYKKALKAGEINADQMLARANYEQTPEARTFWINKVLGSYGLRQIKGTSKNEEFQACSHLQKTPYCAKGSTKLHTKMTGKGSGSFR